ncbi:hypothetical protein B566_EDAN002557 [Ephemera danica]|nr:hypothetical protein B566_EDAN002557 [Ephemera danica]
MIYYDAEVYVLREEGENNSTILSCELNGDDAWSTALWSGDNFEQTKQLAKQKRKGDLFRNQTQDPITYCELYETKQPLCRATGWSRASEDFDTPYTTTIKPLKVNLNGGCWKIVYFGQLLVDYKNNVTASELPGQTQLRQESNGWQVGEILLPSAQSQYEIKFTPETWVRNLWAIRIFTPCYESRVRRVQVDSNTDLDSIRCTVLKSGNSAVITTTTTTTTEATTTEILKEQEEQADEQIPKSDDCKNMWFWIAVICLVIFAVILLYINIKCLIRRDICTTKKDNFSAFRGDPSVRYSTDQENVRNAMPDEIIVTDYDEETDTKAKSLLTTSGFMAPPVPSSPRPIKRAVTPVIEVDEEEDDSEPKYGNYIAKNTGFENPNFKDEFPQYDEIIVTDYDEETDTKAKSLLTTSGFMAPPVPSSPRPIKRAVTPVIEVDEEEDDSEPKYGNYIAKNTGFENPNFKDEFPQYGNYVSNDNDETSLYGNVR